jgi:hypothetical protein
MLFWVQPRRGPVQILSPLLQDDDALTEQGLQTQELFSARLPYGLVPTLYHRRLL